MELFACGRCGNALFFENITCLHCGSALAFLPAGRQPEFRAEFGDERAHYAQALQHH